MSPVQASGQVALSFVDSLKAQPLALALVVMNFALIGFVYFQSVQFNSQRKDNIALFVNVQNEVQKLLAQCVVPPSSNLRGDLRPQDDGPPLPRPRPRIE